MLGRQNNVTTDTHGYILDYPRDYDSIGVRWGLRIFFFHGSIFVLGAGDEAELLEGLRQTGKCVIIELRPLAQESVFKQLLFQSTCKKQSYSLTSPQTHCRRGLPMARQFQEPVLI